MGRFLAGRSIRKKTVKRHMVFWEGSRWKVDSHRKLEMPHGSLGRFWGAKVDPQKNIWNATWFSGKVRGAKVDSQKRIETPHGFLGRFLLRRSTRKRSWHATWFSGKVLVAKVNSQKNLTCHTVFWEGCGWEGRLTKKTWNATQFSGEVPRGKVDSQKKLETPYGFLGRFWLWRWIRKKN